MLHRSRDPNYRVPFGAVPAGTGVRLAVRFEPHENGSAILRLWMDGTELRHPMTPGEGGWWHAEVDTAGGPRLIWYWFERVDDAGATLSWCGATRDGVDGEGITCGCQPESFQITVYDPGFTVPEWLREGAMYQIMVDRFHRGKKDYRHRRDDIIAHGDWAEPPFYIPEGRTQDNAARDFYGGNLPGIAEKLPYLKKLGVTVLYLNPVFAAASNHKYDTGDYKAIDPTFGDDGDFRRLCAAAKDHGIRVMLDGVFSHTGEDSRYFNRYGRYPGKGAYQSEDSPYASWYTFRSRPDDYVCWWGVPTLPNVDEEDPSYLAYMITGQGAVTTKWLRAGAAGWRLDVADELPDAFLDALRAAVKAKHPDAAILGEVWEDASNKVSYGVMRRYLLGGQLDSVMNYPLRRALIDLLTGVSDAPACVAVIERLREHYPRQVFYSLMNHMGTHDRARIVNRLSGAPEPPKSAQRGALLTRGQRALGLERARAMWLFLCGLPGMPSLYYADEAGLEGWSDPFNRGTYPWGHEDEEHLAFFAKALRHRMKTPVLRTGEVSLRALGPGVLGCARWLTEGADAFGNPADGPRRAWCWLNADDKPAFVPMSTRRKPALATAEIRPTAGGFEIPPRACALWNV